MNKAIFVFVIIIIVILTFVLKDGYDSGLNKETIIRIGGSTTMYPVGRKAAKAFMRNHSHAIVTVSESSSGHGIKKLLSNDLEIAHASRKPKLEEETMARIDGKSFTVHTIGKDAIAVIVHPNVHKVVKAISRDQLKKIFFEGTITNWSQINKDLNGKIRVFVRDSMNSGTAAIFGEHLTGSSETPYVKSSEDVHITTLVVSTVSENPYSISYTPLKWVDNSIGLLAYGNTLNEAVLPGKEMIRSGEYIFTRDMYIITLSEIGNNLTKAYVDFLTNKDGQMIVEEEGYTRVR